MTESSLVVLPQQTNRGIRLAGTEPRRNDNRC